VSVLEIISTVLLALGGLVMLAGAAGVARFPDFYTRLHAAGKADTLGQALILLGLALPVGVGVVSLKLVLIVLFVFVLNPTATHALARAAWVGRLQPWSSRKPVADEACPVDAEREDA
jgi:multicomponent Na+:H+ antiporter subunit G